VRDQLQRTRLMPDVFLADLMRLVSSFRGSPSKLE
jgi:hypothetical protein